MSAREQPTLKVHGDVICLTFSTDDYALDFRRLALTKYGSLFAEVTARHGEQQLHVAGFDLLDQRQQELFHQRCRAVNGTVADWQSRLQAAVPGLRELAARQARTNTADLGAVWHQAVTAQDFLQQDEAEVVAYVKDLVVPGCITLVSAPRSSGKSLVALYLSVALATGGVFRNEQLTRRRVLLVDRDNPGSLVRKRLRWLGAHEVTSLKVLTRETAPPLTDKSAWDQFPAEDYDVVLVDSLGASTEGVSEKEGRQTQEFLATLKDLVPQGAARSYTAKGEACP
jgi:AAA domain